MAKNPNREPTRSGIPQKALISDILRFYVKKTKYNQITMTKIQNSKQLAFDLIWDLDIVIWNLFGPILRSGGACNLLFPVYPA